MEEKKESEFVSSSSSRRKMVTTWIKSLHCKSTAADDVVSHHLHRNRSQPRPRSSSQSSKYLKDAGELLPKLTYGSCSLRRMPVRESGFPALEEIPVEHPSRNVVEIIFRTSWGLKPFSGDVEMVFRVCNLNRTVSRFEEYRELVKSRALCDGAGDGRCVADGNEVMGFYCLGTTFYSSACDVGCSAWGVNGGKSNAVVTYSGSMMAHFKAGGGRGRRATMVCRVISGRVLEAIGQDPVTRGGSGYDSLRGDNGELIVFDSRALLPCFLIIYKL